jgi:CBS domain-containing protein
MKIKDIPEYHDRGEVLMLEAKTPVVDAVQKMKSLNYGATLVSENGTLSGIFTERDLLMKVAGEGRDINDLALKDVMTRNLKTANEDDEVTKTMRRMSQGRFRHMPIVDEKNNVTGFISQGDFVAITWHEIFQRLKTKTQSDFINYTQLWMMVAVILVWLTLIPLLMAAS